MTGIYVDPCGFTWVDGVCEANEPTIQSDQMPFLIARIGEVVTPSSSTCRWYVKVSKFAIQMAQQSEFGEFSNVPQKNGDLIFLDLSDLVDVHYKTCRKSDTISKMVRFQDVCVGDSVQFEMPGPARWQKISDTSVAPLHLKHYIKLPHVQRCVMPDAVVIVTEKLQKQGYFRG